MCLNAFYTSQSDEPKCVRKLENFKQSRAHEDSRQGMMIGVHFKVYAGNALKTRIHLTLHKEKCVFSHSTLPPPCFTDVKYTWPAPHTGLAGEPRAFLIAPWYFPSAIKKNNFKGYCSTRKLITVSTRRLAPSDREVNLRSLAGVIIHLLAEKTWFILLITEKPFGFIVRASFIWDFRAA